ncbi:hypothetical protein AB0O01_35230 [Streptomyces sp. NPDC093252]|uniref:hypothetical protein n=1 Tax=Streptomyces sp. NPDC093252 TaxID=3154980 RepID=UPI003413F69A
MKLWTVSVPVAVFLWSTVIAVLGHAAAAAVPLPSLVLLVQRFIPSLTALGPLPQAGPTGSQAGPTGSRPGAGQEAPQ